MSHRARCGTRPTLAYGTARRVACGVTGDIPAGPGRTGRTGEPGRTRAGLAHPAGRAVGVTWHGKNILLRHVRAVLPRPARLPHRSE
jgi:hypothetical protein